MPHRVGRVLFFHGVVFLWGYASSLLSPVLPSVLETFGLSFGAGGMLFAASSAGFMAGSLAGGAATARADRRRILVAAAAGLLASFALAWRSPVYPLLLVAVAGAGSAGGVLTTTVTALTGEIHPDRRAASLNLLNVFFGLGGIVGPLVASAVLVAVGGWRPVFGLSVVPVALALAVAVALRPIELQAALEGPTRAPGYGDLLRRQGMRPFLMGALLEGATVWGMVHWFVTYLTVERGLEILAAGRTLSGFWLGLLAGRLVMSRLLLRFRPGSVLVWASAGAAAVALGLTFEWPPMALMVLGVALGVLLAGAFPTLMGLAMDEGPQLAGPIAGALTVASGLGGLVSPEVIGLVADGFGLAWGMRLIPVCLALLAGVAAAVARRQPAVAGPALHPE
ncbi:MFS transporter [Limnochorda pilosa]|uniref:Major facilitator superfamily (MFS) profile domain-containing protein n=1 Tax=Limnochorda pilosa TaxID=1555112 RepID=A0A0K2SJ42_LIMPI|nr:MFS transporter [Limnochorda pilosa]BAS26854.1 hypothetical protein LIP_0997 [Limnochorda pilosa]